MGMSASQARLLYLTAQLNNLSFRGQMVSDAKLRLALDTQAIQDKYIRALNSSRLFLNSNIFAADGMVAQSEYITLDNLRANGLMVSDGSKVLGYTWQKVATGLTEQIIVGYEDDPDHPIFGMMEIPSEGFSSTLFPAAGGVADTNKMQGIVAASGLGTDDLEVMGYTTVINGQPQDLNAIVIKSQAGFEAILDAIQADVANGTYDNTLMQNFAFDVDTVDMSGYTSAGIPFFQGIFDGNGVTITGLNGTQGLFRDIYGVAKNINISGAVIAAETDAIGGIAGYLGEGGLIENCNVTNLSLTCNLHNTDYPQGYDRERAGVGGVVGYNNGSIRNTSAQGSITVPYADSSFGYIGGFVGANINPEYGNPNNIIENCYSDVNIILGAGTDYSNSINGFIGDDTYEAIVQNCTSLGSITTLNGSLINGVDLANWGPVIESNLINMMALDTRNNNNVLYWGNETDPSFGNGSTVQPSSLTGAMATLSDGSSVNVWLNPGTPGYTDQTQASARNNNLPVINLSVLQADGLVQDGTTMVPDPDNIIGYQQRPIYEEVEKYEMQLVEDPNFTINSLALEEGLRSGAYTLIKPSERQTTETITINGVFYETISLSTCSIITDQTEDAVIRKAEAEYERDMAEIQAQDKKYEMDQKKIDTEYQAYLAEEESIKNVLSKNVERSYNTFKA